MVLEFSDRSPCNLPLFMVLQSHLLSLAWLGSQVSSALARNKTHTLACVALILRQARWMQAIRRANEAVVKESTQSW